ncbi:MAG: DUF58 domain-containing protein [Deltaproteobacteria bacterium]|nr:DUF58 domain-containing protein [Deltaproteobacteria bacterium]
MIPTLTRSGRFVLAAVALFVVVGALSASPPIAALGAAASSAIVVVYLATLSIPRLVRREKIEFAWWLMPSEGGVSTPGVAFRVRAYVRNRCSWSFGPSRLGVFASDALQIADSDGLAIPLPRGRRTDLELRVTAMASGQHFLHGATLMLEGPGGLFRVHVYFPNVLSVKVFPRALAAKRATFRPPTGTALDHAGRHFVRVLGTSPEPRELRELVPGDPFKAIAWKATARTGKLMVRELENEIQTTRLVLLDASATMRAGDVGRTKLDYGVEVAAAYARLAVEQSDRVGFAGFDQRILAQLPPHEGRAHFLRLLDALVAIRAPVDEDVTEFGAAEVARAVAEYVRHQEGLDFRVRSSRPREHVYDYAGLVAHCERALGREGSAVGEVRASDPSTAALRRFCRARGLVIPYREEPLAGGKARGLVEALRAAGGRGAGGGGPASTVLVVSDLEAIDDEADWSSILSTMRLMKARGHRLLVVVPFAPLFTEAAPGTLGKEVHALFARDEARRQAAIEARLRRIAVPVFRVSPRDIPALVFTRAAALKAA